MTEVGRNPGRILSLWREFADRATAGGRRARGIGEPVWAGRSRDELDECHRHEALINAALDRRDGFWLVCPYDRTALDAGTLATVERTHPEVRDRGTLRASQAFDPTLGSRALEGPLAPPPSGAARFDFDRSRLSALRTFVGDAADRAGLRSPEAEDLVLSANELAANAIRHGAGTGVLAVWRDDASLLCQVDDRGRIRDPLVGRAKPTAEQLNGRGLWIVHELCDLVQIRSADEGGNTIRIRMRCDA
jgi:anti-sigma regulatory factor (Ser/Thr protein kinase)